jgi:hypothetical protein
MGKNFPSPPDDIVISTASVPPLALNMIVGKLVMVMPQRLLLNRIARFKFTK